MYETRNGFANVKKVFHFFPRPFHYGHLPGLSSAPSSPLDGKISIFVHPRQFSRNGSRLLCLFDPADFWLPFGQARRKNLHGSGTCLRRSEFQPPRAGLGFLGHYYFNHDRRLGNRRVSPGSCRSDGLALGSAADSGDGRFQSWREFRIWAQPFHYPFHRYNSGHGMEHSRSPSALGMAWLLYKKAPIPGISAPSSSFIAKPPEGSINRKTIRFLVLMGVVILRITTVISLVTFLPTIQKLRGFSLLIAGSSFTVFMVCGALGGLTGGFLADRLGRKPLIVASLFLAIPVFVAFLLFKGPLSFVILALLGFLLFFSRTGLYRLSPGNGPP